MFGLGRDFEGALDMGEDFVPVKIDLTDISLLEKTVRDIMEHNDDISLLVNNAGTGFFGPHEELNSNKIHQMVAVNLEAPMVLCQLLMRRLKKNRGYIINISSVTAKKTNTHGCAYGAVKAGLSNFSESLFEEIRKYGVKVCCIHPDMTKSNFYRNADFCQGDEADSFLEASEVAKCVEWVLDAREGAVISDITLRPQLHRIKRKNVSY